MSHEFQVNYELILLIPLLNNNSVMKLAGGKKILINVNSPA